MKTLTLAAVAALATSPVLAGSVTPAAPDPVVAAPAPAPVIRNYDWTGFYAGGQLGWGQLETTGPIVDEGSGMLFGAHAGYDWDFGTFVVGGAVDVESVDIQFDGGNGSLDGLARAKVRAGYDAGNWLFYGAGGAAYADATLAGTPAENDIGWFAGAGVEYRVNENVSIAGEALYHQWDDFDSTGIDVNTTTVQARVSYRF